MGYVMGLDGGGSKVACLVGDSNGCLLGWGEGGSVNTNYVVTRDAVESLGAAVRAALHEASLCGEEVDVVCMSAPISPDALDQATREYRFGRIVRAAEGETPRWSARFWVDGHIGLTVDAGTGAMARGWDKGGREAGASGWGTTLGDEGSSYWIGVEAMRAILLSYDGRSKPTLLHQPVLDHLGLTDILDLVFRVDPRLVDEEGSVRKVRVAPDSGAESPNFAQPSAGGLYFREERSKTATLSRCQVASLSPVVARVASWGDASAKEIFRRAGLELGRAGKAIIKRLDLTDEDFAVIPFGGVFRAGELVMGAFRNTIEAAAPLSRVVEAPFEPVVGAVLMALSESGVNIDQTILRTVEKSASRFPGAVKHN